MSFSGRSLLAACIVATACFSEVAAQRPSDDPIPGAVRLKNGLILRGLCTSGAPLISGTTPNLRLDLRKIDQGFRHYLVATRQSDPIVPDNSVLPDRHFRIRQPVTGNRPLNFLIGLHQRKPFQPNGRSQVILHLGGGKTEEIDIGIVGIDRRFANVRGLTHRWSFGVSIHALPDNLFYSGIGQPGLMPSAEGFGDGSIRLRMVQMLMEAGKFRSAYQLAVDTGQEFPDLKELCDSQLEKWNEFVAGAALEELQRLKDAGRYRLATRFARRWPDAHLDAVIRVRASQFLQQLEDEQRRVSAIARALDEAVGQVKDIDMRRRAARVCSAIKAELTVHTLPRLEAFELFREDQSLAPEARIALAATGWMLGPMHAVEEFTEAEGLLQVRWLLQDYLSLADGDSAERNRIISQIRTLEGFSIERVAMLIQHMRPVPGEAADVITGLQAVPFEFAESAQLPRAVCIVPAEYDPNRSYPLIVAFPRGGGTAEVTASFWRQQAERFGYFVVVPEIFLPTDGVYEATADQHRKVLNTIVRVKKAFHIDDDRVFIAGHGLGAEAAMDIATAHPDQFAGVVPIAGLGRKHLLVTAHNSPELPWYVVSGTRQPWFSERMQPLLTRLFTRVDSAGRLSFCNAMLAQYPERGFESYAEELPDIFEWMQLQRRPVWSDRIKAVTLRSTDRDWFWLHLDRIDDRHVTLDEPNSPEDLPSSRGNLKAEIQGNLIRIQSAPGPVTVHLSPACPEIDLEQTIRVVYKSKTHRIEYSPSLQDLLESVRKTRDRRRPVMMRVPLSDL